MFSARAIARAARVPSSCFAVSSISRSLSTRTRPALFASKWKSPISAASPFPRYFSSAFRTLEKQGTVDEELVAKFQAELDMEKEMKEYDEDGYPPSVKDYLTTGPFKIIDKPGQEEVELIRKFGDETIRVKFSISDMNSMDEGMEDKALYDEMDDDAGAASTQSGGAQSKQAKADGRVPVANDAAEEEDEFDEGDDPSFPARVNVTIEKPKRGAIQIEAVAQDGMIVIDNFFFNKSAKLVNSDTADAEWERRGMYAGPPFGNLDEDLQVLLERYLDERGINTALALFVPDYIDFKEQKEYLSWLENVKGFIDA